MSLRVKSGCLGGGRKSHPWCFQPVGLYPEPRHERFSCAVLSALALLVNPYPLPFSGVGGSWPSVLYVFCFLSMQCGKGGAFPLEVNLM